MKRSLWIAVLPLYLSGCSMSPETAQVLGGGAIGAAAGGLLGGVIGKHSGDNQKQGAIIGATVGGLLGAVIAQRMNQQTEELQQVPGVNQVAYDEQKQQINAQMKVLFDFDKYDIKMSEASKLDQLASVFAKYPENIVTIEGHTDSVGSDSYNLELSRRRAASIEAYLRSKRLNISSLSSAGYGESRPIASNDNEAGRSQNRRVEILISVDQSRVPQPPPQGQAPQGGQYPAQNGQQSQPYSQPYPTGTTTYQPYPPR
jgi:outer membrane protein OmpA-like peptidoglycan-associated protein